MRLKLGVPLPAELFEQLGIGAREGYRPELLESVQPVIVVNPDDDISNVSVFGDAWTDLAQSFLGGESPGAGGAGNSSWAALYNPLGSGVNVYLDELLAAVAATALIYVRLITAAPGGIASAQKSNKWASGAAPLAELRYNTGGPTGTVVYVLRLPANDCRPVVMNPPWKLPPQSGVLVSSGTLNQALDVSFQWREAAV